MGGNQHTAVGRRAFDEYQRTGRLEKLEAAVAAFQDAVAATPPGDPNLAGRLSNLGGALLTRFELAGDAADLDAAIDAGRRAVDITPPGHPNLAGRLSNLGGSLRARFKRSGDPGDLDAAIDAVRRAADLTPPGHPNLAEILSNLGGSLRTRFERSGDPGDLDAAIDAGRRAVEITPPGHPNLAGILSNLGGSLRTRFERSGDPGDLDAAIDAGWRAVELSRPGHPDFAARLSGLGISLYARFERAGNTTVLDAAIDACQRAVDLTPPGHPDLATFLSNLGAALHDRFERSGNTTDLDAAIDACQRAVDLTPPGHPSIAARLSNLGGSMGSQYERTADAADLDAAIDACQRAADLTPPGHPDLAMYLSNLSGPLRIRFERSGNTADLEAAIDACRRAANLCLPGDPKLAAILSELGNSLRTRFGRAGDAADLDAAIDAGRRAVEIIPPGNPNLARYLTNVAASLGTRFERAKDAADLDAAIDAARRAVEITPPGHPDLAVSLSNLGNLLRTRFERARYAADLDAAIDAARRAVEITPPGHPELAMFLSNLGVCLLTRFERTGDDADLDAAIDATRRAADLTPPGHPDLALYLSNLSLAIHARFERAGDAADLDAAIGACQRAADLTPPGHPNLTVYLGSLGSCLRTRFELAGDTTDLDTAIDCWRQASQASTGTAAIRLSTARLWGSVAADAKRPREAAEGYAVAVGLLPTVAWHGLDRATREEQLAQWAGLAADAAASAIIDRRPDLAVELLEQGRSVLWTQALNMRNDLTRLPPSASGLARRLENIRVILDSPLPVISPTLPEQAAGSGPDAGRTRQLQDAVELRMRKAREWDEVLNQIRALPGLEHFLAALPYPSLTADLHAACVDGSVVIVNASRHGCHALIVDPGNEQPRVVDLPDLSLDSAVSHANEMLRGLAGAADSGRPFLDREKTRHALLDVLDWLWDVVAEPVLTELRRTSSPATGSPWPRVWWCPTGPLAVLPIHAAGHHPRLRAATGSADCVSDRVISSYTPIIGALTRASRPAPGVPVRQLTVGVAAPGLPPLHEIPAELEVLASHFPPGADNRQLAGPQATRAGVLTAMTGHSWVHLACHAGQQHADPSRSGFALFDGQLTIAELIAQPDQHRDLAFLSACQTATGSVHHLDEAIHLAAAMQFLGYRHVIATMWTIADPPAPHVADAFYAALKLDGQLGPSRAAEALHNAVRALRQADPANPQLWAPYIHLGN
jgi:predicted metal-dependent phosphoesterase TrpH